VARRARRVGAREVLAAGASDLRYNWVHVDLAAIDAAEMRELVEDAWAFCVRSVAEEYAAAQGYVD
jgi:hypothetical protein